jgi:hypothetical protein
MLKYEYLILQSKAPRKTKNFLNKVTKIKNIVRLHGKTL